MKLIFMGSPTEALPVLEKLIDISKKNSEFQLLAVISKPPKRKGRRKVLSDPPVAEFGKQNNLKVLQPESAKNSDFLAEIVALQPDIIITAAYGEILTSEFLAIPSRGVINIHPSLLPLYRGATPVPASLLAGDSITGVSILFTVKELDAGAIICQESIDICDNETADILLIRSFRVGAELLTYALELLKEPEFKGTPQDSEEIVHCKKILKEDGKISWNESSTEIINKFRAFYPWPGVFSFSAIKGKVILTKIESLAPEEVQFIDNLKLNPGEFAFHKKLKSLLVGTKTDIIKVQSLKPENSKEQDAISFWNGLKTKSNEYFTDDE